MWPICNPDGHFLRVFELLVVDNFVPIRISLGRMVNINILDTLKLCLKQKIA